MIFNEEFQKETRKRRKQDSNIDFITEIYINRTANSDNRFFNSLLWWYTSRWKSSNILIKVKNISISLSFIESRGKKQKKKKNNSILVILIEEKKIEFDKMTEKMVSEKLQR